MKRLVFLFLMTFLMPLTLQAGVFAGPALDRVREVQVSDESVMLRIDSNQLSWGVRNCGGVIPKFLAGATIMSGLYALNQARKIVLGRKVLCLFDTYGIIFPGTARKIMWEDLELDDCEIENVPGRLRSIEYIKFPYANTRWSAQGDLMIPRFSGLSPSDFEPNCEYLRTDLLPVDLIDFIKMIRLARADNIEVLEERYGDVYHLDIDDDMVTVYQQNTSLGGMLKAAGFAAACYVGQKVITRPVDTCIIINKDGADALGIGVDELVVSRPRVLRLWDPIFLRIGLPPEQSDNEIYLERRGDQTPVMRLDVSGVTDSDGNSYEGRSHVLIAQINTIIDREVSVARAAAAQEQVRREQEARRQRLQATANNASEQVPVECCVCLESYSATRRPVAFRCGHMTCNVCRGSLRVCPQCRSPLDNVIDVHLPQAADRTYSYQCQSTGCNTNLLHEGSTAYVHIGCGHVVCGTCVPDTSGEHRCTQCGVSSRLRQIYLN